MDGLDLYKKRKHFGITQSDLAAHLGYYSNGEPNRSMIARMESGMQKINFRHKMLIDDYFEKLNFKMNMRPQEESENV